MSSLTDRARLTRVAVGVVSGVALVVLLQIAGQRSLDARPRDPAASEAAPWPFAFLGPDVVVDRSARRKMNERDVVAETLPASGRQVSIFVASTIDVDAERLIASVQDIEALRTSEIVPLVRRFSAPPVLADLAKLRLEEEDLNGIAACTPGDCSVKLTVAEMRRLQAAIAGGAEAWRSSVQTAFRQLVLRRVQTYLARGRGSFEPIRDHDAPVEQAAIFTELLGGLGFLQAERPDLVRYLDRYPSASLEVVDSFLYWSIEDYAPKPIVTVWHDVILRGSGRPGEPELLIGSSQVMATHYFDGAVSLTALVRDDTHPNRRYLVYVNRASIDMLGGFMARVRRFFLQRRLRGEARSLFDKQRTRIEKNE